ncbi:ankyrin repeat, PH and SEC7 domain containing protein secG-like, partial [Physella acuta]|uniref:ankyrin repeat, PH and SEC7 domain containing protein secG-like n=1 Tax=Physella acuta TaxID=109671 RepID=UPI0027DDAB24
FPLDINICTLKAATKGDAIVLTKLLSLHPRMSYGDEHNRRAIHYAANNGHLECVRLLLKAGAISNCADHFGRTPLHMACAMGFTEIVRLLVKQCGQINSCRTESGENAVHATAAAGHVEIMEFLIEHGGDINATTSKLKGGETPLHKAISTDKPEMVDLLCRYDAKLNIADASGRYPMHLACEKGFLRCIATLVQHGASLEVTDAHGQTPLFAAVSENQVTIAKFLIEQGANVLAVDSSGYTPLHRASYKGNLELIEYLVHSGAEINARSQKTLQTPLMFAVTFGKLEAIKKLIELGGDTTLPDAKGQTPLHLVHLKMTGEPVDKIVRALLEGGGRLDQRDDGNFTPLQRCLISGVIRRNHSLPCIQLLCQAGSYLGPDQYTMGKKSPLFWLAYSGFLQEAMYLVKAGWDLRDETWIILPGKDHLQDKLHEFMIITYRTVPSLLACTRKGLRAHLFEVNQHREILSVIDCLPLPSPLKSYLKLQDVDPYDLEALSFVE